MGGSVGRMGSEAREFWEVAVRLWEESGISVRDFCRREGLKAHSLHGWRRKLRSEVSSSGIAPEASEAVAVEADANAQRQKPGRRRLAGRPAAAFLPVRLRANEIAVSASSASPRQAADSRIEIVGGALWRVRVQTGFDPTTLAAVLAVLEQRSC